MELSSLATALIMGTNLVLFFCFYMYGKISGVEQPKESKLSEPLTFSISSIYNLTKEVSKLGLILLIVYLCEKHPPNPHSSKVHDMDMFWFMTTALFVYSLLDIRKSKTTDILNREQTEEWKGWMQFMFLLYHYFSAHEVYNSIRVMITCYVWMTGFGNFSFFYIKRDFGALRLLQMLWRLNFLVLCLCLTLGNTYILYYICPLHTFFFFVVFATMCPLKHLNHTKWGIRVKLLVVAALIFLVWDMNCGIFQGLFGLFMSTEPVVGATSGTLYEWYFRTSLDHWSTFLGMVFALNFPMSTAWLKVTENLPAKQQIVAKGIPAVAAVLALVWWSRNILPLQKLDYNAGNAYFGFIPMICYIFLRNLHPTLRQWYLHPLHNLGKITLETYLMQHHVWLTSNAKTILTVIPGWPKVNLLLCGIMYVVLSKELYRLTMSLRGMLMPDGPVRKTLINMAGLVATFVVGFLLAWLLQATVPTTAGTLTVAFLIALLIGGCLFLVLLKKLPTDDEKWVTSKHRDAESPSDRQRKSIVGGALLSFLLFLTVSTYASPRETLVIFNHSSVKSFSATAKCSDVANQGHWVVKHCADKENSNTLCTTHSWVWSDVPDNCHIRYFNIDDTREMLKGKKVSVVGDSTTRNVFFALLRAQGDSQAQKTMTEKHGNFQWVSPNSGVTEIQFTWAPFVSDLETELKKLEENPPDILVMGGGLWDCLHNPDKLDSLYIPTMAKVKDILGNLKALKLWLVPSMINDQRLQTEEKKALMTENKVQQYRKAVENLNLWEAVDGHLDGNKLTQGRLDDSFDGVHYSDETYDLFAQVFANLVFDSKLSTHGNEVQNTAPKQTHSKPIGLMANPKLGLFMLIVITICIICMDSYVGIPTLVMRTTGLFNEALTWEKAYETLHQSLGISLLRSSSEDSLKLIN